MPPTTQELLARLGRRDSIASLVRDAGWTREQFDHWWREECRRRVPATQGTARVSGLHGAVGLTRDRFGIPHVQAKTDADLFFGFGYATAQDRLFQLDFLRRRASGRLAEILGPEAVESDRLYRTLGLKQVAEREWAALPAATRDLTSSYTAGINALREASRHLPPVEFDLLGYRPEPWTPLDCLLILGEFRWYLTGRFPVIVIPELVKRALGDGPLYRDFLLGEADEESILQLGDYPAVSRADGRAGTATGDPDGGQGSNNWVLAGTRTVSGRPLVASDPHVPFGAVSIWHQVHLQGGSFHVAGVALAGVPAVMIGRTPRVAWGLTNNICSLRDLYWEQTDPAQPGYFLFDGRWEPATVREEVIRVQGAEPVQLTVRSSRNGPIVDDLLPPVARHTGPVALRWLGERSCGWLTALHDMDRATSVDTFRAALQPWLVPTFNLVFADADGRIGHQTTGRIPVRRLAERGYRPGADPLHQWAGLLQFEEMPRLADPPRGYVVTANNRLTPADFPAPLSGTWSSGHRARRIREAIEARPRMTSEDCQVLQQDVVSGRALACVPALVALLAEAADPRVRQATTLLRAWDGRATTESVPAALFNVFFVHWCRAVVAERFAPEQVELLATAAGGLATRLLHGDSSAWFARGKRLPAVQSAFQATLDELTSRLGPDLASWTWGRLHRLVQKHVLSGRGDLGQLLDRSGQPTRGDGNTVCSSTPDAAHAAYLGAGFRMTVDFSDLKQRLSMVEVGSVSGHPGSPHYDDQLPLWAAGGYHDVDLAGEPAVPTAHLTLEPTTGTRP